MLLSMFSYTYGESAFTSSIWLRFMPANAARELMRDVEVELDVCGTKSQPAVYALELKSAINRPSAKHTPVTLSISLRFTHIRFMSSIKSISCSCEESIF